MWKSDKNETFDVLFILFDVVIFVVVIIRFSTFWSTQKTFSTFWFRRSDQLKRPFRRSEIFGLSTFWSSTFRPPPKFLTIQVSTKVRLYTCYILYYLNLPEEEKIRYRKVNIFNPWKICFFQMSSFGIFVLLNLTFN